MPHIAHRKHVKHHKKPETNTVLSKLVLAMAVIEPLMTLPQVYEIWVRHETAGVSFATWAFFIIAAVIWLLYGLQIKNVPIIVSSALWIAVEGSVVIGLIIY